MWKKSPGIKGIEIWQTSGEPTIYFVDAGSEAVWEHWFAAFPVLYEWLKDPEKLVYLYNLRNPILMVKL